MIAVAACKICLGIMPIAFSAPTSFQSAYRFYRVMLRKRGLCWYAVSVCSSVCLSVRPSIPFVDHVKNILEIFSPSGSHTILV